MLGVEELSTQDRLIVLRARKLQSLLVGQPRVIATANIGCLHFLQEGTDIPVRHWLELLADRLPDTNSAHSNK